MLSSKKIGLFLGPALFLILLLTPPQFGLKPEAWKVVALAALMLAWWISEALPLAVTAMVPLALLPLLGLSDMKKVATAYGDPVIFLFLGGFMLALAMERWNLHRRIALSIVKLVGVSADGIVLGFMAATGLVSMWISNTATTIMMLPIALSVIGLLRDARPNPENDKGLDNFSKSILLGIAYAASLGGMGTLIGTPPNVVFKGFMESTFQYKVGFFDWMLVGTPLAILLILMTWWVNVKWLFPNRLGAFVGAKEVIDRELAALGKPSAQEKAVFWVFMATVFLWITRGLLVEWLPWLRLTDEIIAVLAMLSLFLIPVDFKKETFLLEWRDTRDLPWGILLLFGGGLALADALHKTGLIDLIGQQFAGAQMNYFILVLALVTATILLSEVMSNVALVTVFLPVIGAVSQGLGMEPMHLTVPVTLAASAGFMLPMATPPNAIVFGSGHLHVRDMMRSGLWLDLFSALLIALFAALVVRAIF